MRRNNWRSHEILRLGLVNEVWNYLIFICEWWANYGSHATNMIKRNTKDWRRYDRLRIILRHFHFARIVKTICFAVRYIVKKGYNIIGTGYITLYKPDDRFLVNKFLHNFNELMVWIKRKQKLVNSSLHVSFVYVWDYDLQATSVFKIIYLK